MLRYFLFNSCYEHSVGLADVFPGNCVRSVSNV